MKIAIITPFPPLRGGISKYSYNLYKDLSKSNEVYVFNFTRQYPSFLFPGKSQYLDNKRINKSKNIFTVIDSINPFTWRKTADLIIQKKIDKLIFRFWNPFFLPCYIYIIKYLKKKSNIKIFSICDNAFSHESFYFQKFLMKKFINSTDGVITMSKNVESQISIISKHSNIRVFPLPIIKDFQKGAIAKLKKNSLDKDKVIFLFFGLIREYKGIDILLNAINQIDNMKLKKTNFLIVGESYININKYKKILNEDRRKYVEWYNQFIPDKEVSSFFLKSDYIVLPYKKASQSGIIPMAYQFNKPVICSDVSGLKELINENTGFVFKNENVNELKEIIEECIENDKTFTGFTDMQKKLSTKTYADNILNFINE